MNKSDIPQEWDYVKLSKYIQLQGGYAFKSQHFVEFGVPLIRISNIEEKGIDYSDIVFVPYHFIKEYADFSLEVNDNLISMTGDIGKSCIIKSADLPALLNQRVGRFRIKNNLIKNKFIYYLIKTDEFKNQIIKRSAGGVQANISSESLEKIDILLPTRIEQQKIILILESIDNYIDKTHEIIEKYEMMKQGLMYNLFTKGINENGKHHTEFKDSELGEIPISWKVVDLESLKDKSDRYSLTGGPFGSDLKTNDYTNEGVRVIQLQNMGEGHFINKEFIYTSNEKAEELNGCKIYPNEIIIAKMAEPLARACILPDVEPFYLMCSDGIRLKLDEDHYDYSFYMNYINSNFFRKIAIDNAAGTTRLRIGLGALKKINVIKPPLNEQKKIGKILFNINNEILSEQKNLNKLQKIKTGLIQDLLTGKVRVKT